MDAPVNASIFPHLDEIPQQVRLAGTIEQREYLCDGVLRRWEGPLQDVESPVCLHNSGRLDRQRIGAYPLLTGREALDVLAAGARAWNQGRGVWPTMPLVRKAVTLSACQGARSSRNTIANLVSNMHGYFRGSNVDG